MTRLYIAGILFLSFFITSCGKNKIANTRYYTYSVNPFYTGTHPTTDVGANIYIQDKEISLEFQIEMKGALASNSYKLAIYEADTSLYGFKTTPIYDLGNVVNKLPVTIDISTTDFATFTNDFKGYLIIQDPNNISFDTTTFLVFGKIGSDF